MFSVFDRGQRRPPVPFICVAEEPLRPDRARLAAWATALGQERLPERRPHRGQLPDVDWSRVTAAPARPGPFVRLWRLFRRMRPPDGVPPGAAQTGLAPASARPYVAPEASGNAPAAGMDRDRRAA